MLHDAPATPVRKMFLVAGDFADVWWLRVRRLQAAARQHARLLPDGV
jgi:hypothetical protein